MSEQKQGQVRPFNAMAAKLERQRAPDLDDNGVLRRMLLGRLDVIDALEAKVEVQSQALAIAAPKVEAYDAFMDDRGHCCLRTVARIMELGHSEFFDWIKSKGYVFTKD